MSDTPQTLTLGIYGGAKLTDDRGAVLWDSEDDDEAREELGEFIEEEDADDLLDYLYAKNLCPDPDAVEVVIEVAEGEEEELPFAIPAGHD
ncbi:MAG TPA: hypothetical protein VET48_04815 [Steroidobacteraceae bacterium]|nr:hypothetical protein [Steroidobacteraceae bacterium]